LGDDAALVFSRAFYGQIFGNLGVSMCEAYQHAVDVVRLYIHESSGKKVKEFQKFKIFHHHGDEPCSPIDSKKYEIVNGPYFEKGKNPSFIKYCPEVFTKNFIERNLI